MSSTKFSLQAFFSWGVTEEQPAWLQGKIKVCNRITTNVLLAGVPFLLLCLFYLPEITWIGILAVSACLFILLLNLFQQVYLSRILGGLLGCVTGTVAHAIVLPAGSSPNSGLLVFVFAFLIIPFVIFDLREKLLLGLVTVVNILVICATPLLVNLLETDTSFEEFFKLPWTNAFFLVISALVTVISLVVVLSENLMFQQQSSELVAKMEDRNKALLSSEEELRQSLEQIDKSKEEERRRNWASEGMALFSAMLRDAANVEQVYDRLLARLVSYLEANQGGLYVVKQEEEQQLVIKLEACFAYNRKKYVEQEFGPGEGLLGQAYLEAEKIVLTEIPEGYISITSGLGEAQPRALVIIPLKLNEQIAGLLELASFKDFEPYEIDFLEKLGETIASSIISINTSTRTRELLELTQVQTEEQRAREEELRQNMEELQTTQEEMRRVQSALRQKESENEQALAELQQIRVKLEEELAGQIEAVAFEKEKIEVFLKSTKQTVLFINEEGEILLANAAVQKMFGYRPEELLSKKPDMLLQPQDEKGVGILKICKQLRDNTGKVLENYQGINKMYGFAFPVEVRLGAGTAKGQKVYSLLVTDISARKKRETSMQKAMQNLQNLQRQLMEKQQQIKELEKTTQEQQQLIASQKAELQAAK